MLNEVVKDIAATVKENVQAGINVVISKLEPRLKDLEGRIENLPVPEKGDPGDSVTLDDMRPIIEDAFVRAADQLKAPEVDYDQVKSFISEQVFNIRVPVDGKSITAEDVKPLLMELVEAIELPVPEKGEKGDSVTLEDVHPLIDEAVKSAVAQIKAPKDGEPGKDGPPIDMDALKMLIDTAVEKAVASIHIPEPKQPENGKDALDIEILPEIDQEKSYSRNSYAIYKGGLWRSYERTKGMRGWETVVDGIADIQIGYDGEREIEVMTEKSSGEKVCKQFIMPVVLDRGVYNNGQEYTKNDGVTFAGSYWIAQKDAPDGRPGDSNADFRLAVKRGRDANVKVKVGE